MRMTILEFAPCVDWICHFQRDAEEGYAVGDGEKFTIHSGAKLRPRVASIYAGGKATNVARVIDRLLSDKDAVDIELMVFRPDSPEGNYLHELQSQALKRVRLRPVIIAAQARLCMDLFDPTTPPDNRVAFNISPRAWWGGASLERALDFASQISTDLLLLAGNPPVLETTGELATDLYAKIIESVRPQVKTISLDTEKQSLLTCLQGAAKPDVIKINAKEYSWIDEKMWDDFDKTLMVTQETGCWVRENNQPALPLAGAKVDCLYSTVGAGDAVHAGFTLARWVRGFDTLRAARFGQAVAAAVVNSVSGTRDIDIHLVEKFFIELENPVKRSDLE
ncbi:MAG: PfkB family carbohydrate kinase [Acidobacteriota bacterium]